MARNETRRTPLTLRRGSPTVAEPQPLARAERTELAESDRGTTSGSRPPRRFARLSPFWKALIITSFVINLVLLTVILLLAGFVYQWREQLIGTTMLTQGFARNNVAELRNVVDGLEGATIRTQIPLDSVTIPLDLNVPVDQVTTVTLMEPVPLTLENASIDLGNGNRLRANSINLNLPPGTPLTIALRMNIPINQPLPLKDKGVTVPVEIPLSSTELGPQFVRLGQIVDRLAGPAAPLLGMDIPPAPPAPQATPVPTAQPDSP